MGIAQIASSFAAALIFISISISSAQARETIAHSSVSTQAMLSEVRSAITQIRKYRTKGALMEAEALRLNNPFLSDFESPLVRAVLGVSDRRLEAELLTEFGLLQQDLGRHLGAQQYFEDALRVPRLAENYNAEEIASIKLRLGISQRETGNYADAREKFVEIIADSSIDSSSSVVEEAQLQLFIIDALDAPNASGAAFSEIGMAQ